MNNPKIIICDCDHKDIKSEKKVFEREGFDFKWLHCQTEQEVIDQCQDAVALLNQYTPMNETVFKALPSLKIIVRYGVGYDNVNLDDATKYGIQVCNVPDYGTNEVADQALALMMSLVRKTFLIGSMTKSGIWNYQEAIPVKRLSCSTVGIIGVGRIGTAFSKRANALGCRVIAFDTEADKPNRTFPKDVEMLSLDEVLAQSDIISLHCTLTAESKHIINDEALSKMKNGSYIVNVARGGLVDEAALERALSCGKLAGAGIDVVANEPLKKESQIFNHPNAIITPHMAWYSEESAEELKRKCAEEAVRFINGQPVRCPVNNLKNI